MAIENQEVTAATTSAAPAGGQVNQPTGDAAGGTPTSTNGAAAGTPPAEDNAFKEFQADLQRSIGGTEEGAGGQPTEQPPDTTGKPAAAGEEGGQPNDLSQAIPEKLDERPEWKTLSELVTPENRPKVHGVLRQMFKREFDLKQTAEKARPAVEAFNEMVTAVQGNPQGLANMRRLIVSYDSDPESAIPMLEMLLNDCKARSGSVISDPDLAAKEKALAKQYDDGDISPEFFKSRREELLELQKSKLTVQKTSQQRQRQQQEQIKAAREARLGELSKAETDFITNLQANDPDFGALEDMLRDKVQLETEEFVTKNNGQWPEPKDVKIILETAYKKARQQAIKFMPARPAMRPVNGSGSLNHNRPTPAPGSFEEFQAELEKARSRHR